MLNYDTGISACPCVNTSLPSHGQVHTHACQVDLTIHYFLGYEQSVLVASGVVSTFCNVLKTCTCVAHSVSSSSRLKVSTCALVYRSSCPVQPILCAAATPFQQCPHRLPRPCAPPLLPGRGVVNARNADHLLDFQCGRRCLQLTLQPSRYCRPLSRHAPETLLKLSRQLAVAHTSSSPSNYVAPSTQILEAYLVYVKSSFRSIWTPCQLSAASTPESKAPKRQIERVCRTCHTCDRQRSCRVACPQW